MRTYMPPDAILVPSDATCVFQGKIYGVYQWQQRMFDGSYETFEMLKRPDTVKVIAVKDNDVVVLEQEQPGAKVFFDLPGGRHDVDNESELNAAQRELKEETGLAFNNWKLVEVSQPFTKIEWFVYLYVATDYISTGEQSLDAGEKIKVDYMSLAQLQELLQDPRSRYLPEKVLAPLKSLDELDRFPALS